MAKTVTTKKMTARPGDLTVGDLRGFIEGEDDSRVVSVNTSYPDRPGEIGEISVTLTDPSERMIPKRDLR